MTLRSRLAKLEERHPPEREEPQYLDVILVRRTPDGKLLRERRLRFLSTPAGLVRVPHPDAGQEEAP